MEVISFVALAAGLIIGLGAIGACIGIGNCIGNCLGNCIGNCILCGILCGGLCRGGLSPAVPGVRDGCFDPQTAPFRQRLFAGLSVCWKCLPIAGQTGPDSGRYTACQLKGPIFCPLCERLPLVRACQLLVVMMRSTMVTREGSRGP